MIYTFPVTWAAQKITCEGILTPTASTGLQEANKKKKYLEDCNPTLGLKLFRKIIFQFTLDFISLSHFVSSRVIAKKKKI